MNLAVSGPTYSRHRSLARLLDNILAAALPGNFDTTIAVVDNNSPGANP